MPNQRLQYLFDLYTQGNCTPAEKRELYVLALASKNEVDVQKLLDKYWDMQTIEFRMPEEKAEVMVQSILGNETKVIPRVHRIHFRRSRWWAAAAAIIIMLGVGSYFTFFNKGEKKNEFVKTEPAKDVKAPATNRAMITLADGRTVYLDSAMNGQLAVQGNIKLVKLANGQIAYQTASGEIIKELKYNTLNNPRGSKVIDMTLADGSRVWLNAGSSVTFPVAFIGNERKVSITGEAYFEVVHNTSMPFKVSKGEMEVTVLGTHFNVNAFDDEADIKVTLLEGSVKVNNDKSIGMLKPGQQAQVSNTIKVVDNADLKAVMAWKNGFFNFNNADIKILMREIARWYDVEVVYESAVPNLRFGGEMPRTTNLSQVMEILKTSGVKFTIEGRRVTIRP